MEDGGEDCGEKSYCGGLPAILDECSSASICKITKSVFATNEDEDRTEISKGYPFIQIHSNLKRHFSASRE